MPSKVSIDVLDKIRPKLRMLVTENAKRLTGLQHCDVRMEFKEEKGAMSENGQPKASAEDVAFDFGVRVIAGGKTASPGYYGKILGPSDIKDIETVVWEGIEEAHRRARASARQKAIARKQFGALAESLYSMGLAPVRISQDTIKPIFRDDPRSVPLDATIKMAVEGCQAAKGTGASVVYAATSAVTSLIRELYVSSEGADIDYSYAQTEGFCIVIGSGKDGTVEIYDFTGHQRGWEVLTEGYSKGIISLKGFEEFCKELGRNAEELVNAPRLKPSEKDVVVVTDPHFNTLVAHEVVGHPSELDRALKFETAYAGRSWFFRDLKDNMIGKQVASPLVSAYSDPTVEGYGHYPYDHDGTPSRRAYHIRNGVFEEFLNSRQTAAVLGVEPNGSFRATESYLIPLIRMSNTVFAPGDRDPQEIIKEVDRGYYVSGHRTPSIAESRENFRITAVKVYEIRNGELGQVYRDGGITSDTRDYFMSIDAVGNDFRMYPIPNCGKGQPMQAKRMSNGGPTMRGIARLTGGG
jgi:TldD protein